MNAITFSGLQETDFSLSQSNLPLYQQVASGKIRALDIGVSKEQARQEVKVHEHFKGIQMMPRSVRVVVEPCLYSVNIAQKSASGIAGSAHPLCSIDIHELVTARLEEVTAPRESEQTATVKLADGTIVEGTLIEDAQTGMVSNEVIETDYFTVTCQATDYKTKGNFFYSIEPKRDVITPSNCLGFKVTTTVLFNNEPVETIKKEIRPTFTVRNGQLLKFKSFSKAAESRVLEL